MKRLRIGLLSLLFSALSCLAAFAQSGTIVGRTTTAEGKPAPYVSVSLKELPQGASSNADGYYEITRVKPGTYTLHVSAVGLTTQEKAVTVVAREKVTVDFMLPESAAELQEVVVTHHKGGYKVDRPSNSLRLDEPLLEAPQNIQVITAATLADQQVISMSDGVLRNVSGATRLEHWGDLYTRVNMRGSRASSFRNGMNVTSTWGPLTEDMSFVDHVEFVKGPAGFMMSNGEPSGIYNVVTKKPTGTGFNGEANVTLGSFDLYRATLDLDGNFDKDKRVLYRLNVMGQTQGSFRPYESTTRYSIAPVITYKLDDRTTLTAEYNYQYAQLPNVGLPYVFSFDGYASLPRKFTMGVPGLEPNTINDHSLFVYLQHQFDDHWKITAQAAYFNYQQVGSSMWPDSVKANGDIYRSVSSWDASNVSKFGQVFVNGDITTGPVHHRILGGLDLGNKNYLADWSQYHALDAMLPNGFSTFNIYSPNNGAPAGGLPVFDRSTSLEHRATGRMDQRYSGLYAQDELGFFDNRLRLTLAGRYTYVRESNYGTVTEDKKFTPRVGLSASITPNTSVYALYDQSFLPQSGLLRSGEQPKPITGNNLEVGIKRDWFDGRWNTTLAVYQILKNNELSADPDPTNNPNNLYSVQLGQTKSKGVELDLRGELMPGLNLVANYAYTDLRVTKATSGAPEGTRLPGYAKHNSNAWLSYQMQSGVLKGTGISGGFTYLADRSTWAWSGASGREELPNYFRLDGGLFWQKNNIRLTANAFNILDKYLYSGSSYGTYYYWQAEAPRNYRLSVGYKF